MLNDKNRSELEQSTALLCEAYPPMLYGLFVGLLKEGFNESQAMQLVVAFIHSTQPSAGGGSK